jgi:hypothetical protein
VKSVHDGIGQVAAHDFRTVGFTDA